MECVSFKIVSYEDYNKLERFLDEKGFINSYVNLPIIFGSKPEDLEVIINKKKIEAFEKLFGTEFFTNDNYLTRLLEEADEFYKPKIR